MAARLTQYESGSVIQRWKQKDVASGIYGFQQFSVIDDIMKDNLIRNSQLRRKINERPFCISLADKDHAEIRKRIHDRGQGTNQKFKILFQDMLAHIEAHKILSGQAEVFSTSCSKGRYVFRRLEVDTVFDHIERPLVAIFAERLGNRLVRNPDMIDMIVKVHNSLDLIVYDGLNRNCPPEIVPILGMKCGDHRDMPLPSDAQRELARSKWGVGMDNIKIPVFQNIIEIVNRN